MNLEDFSRILFAFVAVIGFIGIAALVARKMGLAAGAHALAKARRLSLVESLPIDARRRAVIIRCDNREHLVILGQTGETLVAADLPPRPAIEAEETGRAPAPFATALASLTGARTPASLQSANDADAA